MPVGETSSVRAWSMDVHIFLRGAWQSRDSGDKRWWSWMYSRRIWVLWKMGTWMARMVFSSMGMVRQGLGRARLAGVYIADILGVVCLSPSGYSARITTGAVNEA